MTTENFWCHSYHNALRQSDNRRLRLHLANVALASCVRRLHKIRKPESIERGQVLTAIDDLKILKCLWKRYG